MSFKKYDIVLLDLDPPKGHAQAGVRPAVILQSNNFARASTTIIVPLTTSNKKAYPSQFWIEPTKGNGLLLNSCFLGTQITTIDLEFIIKKIGYLEEKYYPQVKEALAISLDWENDF